MTFWWFGTFYATGVLLQHNVKLITERFNMTFNKLVSSRMAARRSDGFTLVEMLLVLTILAILAGVVLPKMIGHTEHAREVKAKTDIEAFVTGLSQFEIDNGSFPNSREGLDALIIKPHDAKDTWKGPYIQKNKIPLDPWQQPYVYVAPGKRNPAFFDVYSRGKDGQDGKAAIGNWED
jgi:general secretion pathway protein G